MYTEWPSFHDLYTTLIDNNKSLAGAQKLHYLKANVSGEAENLIKSFQITDTNYEEAWKLLCSRYNNKRFIVDAHISSFLDIPILRAESAGGIKQMLDTIEEAIRALAVLGLPTQHWDALLVHILGSKLDNETRRQWELTTKRNELPTFKQLTTFLESRWQSLEMVSTTEIKPNLTSILSNRKSTKSNTQSFVATPTNNCAICSDNHMIYGCPKFRQMDYKTRSQVVMQHKLCFNCLKSGHIAAKCGSQMCKICKRRHNTLLHQNNAETCSTMERRQPEEREQNPATVVKSHFSVEDQPHQVLLYTALVYVCGKGGRQHMVRVLLDSGSQASFITKSLVQRIGLKGKSVSVAINGIGQTNSGNAQTCVNVTFSSRIAAFNKNISVFVLDKITGMIPSIQINTKEWTHLDNIPLADPYYNEPGKIDMLLGADVFGELLLHGKLNSKNGSPMAQNSTLGWILSGKLKTQVHSTLANFHVQLETIDQTLQKFWELEEIHSVRMRTAEELQCEQVYEETHVRMQDGRYMVTLPFMNNEKKLGKSREAAVVRFKQMEHKFKRNHEFCLQYTKFIHEYLTLGHMEEVPHGSTRSVEDTFYLPHHAVIKEDSSTTKLRVVFNASKQSGSGISLNDKLLVGPTLQHDLISLLIRWRKHLVVVTADIEKMYRQIKINPAHTDFQRIIWRNSPSEELKEYRLTTVTYGTACAPYLAIRTLQQIANDEKQQFPIGAEVALRDFYVDDLITGANSIESAKEIQIQIDQLLKSGGFQLRKWCSNRLEILENIPIEHREGSIPVELNVDQSIKTLGIQWYPSSDKFGIIVNLDSVTSQLTKRTFLADVAKLFDPMGWLAPSVIIAKIMFQSLWQAGLSWDDELPQHLSQKWLTFREELNQLQEIKLDRWLGYRDSNVKVQLHGFSDASNLAYAAVVYSRVTFSNGMSKISILASKTKVAPIKQISIPRLELCGALLLAKLIGKIKLALEIPNTELFAWTDSMVVMSWIKGSPNRWKTFIANRVTQINNEIDQKHWHYVASTDNPADCASRGVSPSWLKNHPLWWSGPTWLSQEQQHWPVYIGTINPDIDMEEKNIKISSLTVTPVYNSHELLDRFSSLTMLKRVTAYCFRWISNVRLKKNERNTGFLSAQELQRAMTFWIKYVQQNEFGEEITALQNDKELHHKSRILSLHPFLDSDGILRVGGRLQNSQLQFSTKHQILLGKGTLTQLIVSHAHLATLHGGSQMMLGFLQQHYWIIGARDMVRRHGHRCMTCFRMNAVTRQQLMGSLPMARITQSRPFSHSGIDFAGPLLFRASKLRNAKTVKGYVAVFVCLVSKAIHLEPVGDLTTQSFIGALRRFIARRGMCTNIYSDCGSNFIGANKELSKLFREEQVEISNRDPIIAKMLAENGINWHFIPPASPHFGGLWEAGVKSMKSHLKKIAGNNILTFEEMATLLAQIEACLNSRPLAPISNDINDCTVLTPGHFLIGEAPLTIPEPSLLNIQQNRLKSWQLTQSLFQQIWKKWSAEYLTRMQQRPKWNRKHYDMKVGDLVLIKDERHPSSRWLRGRITETHPGPDGHVRVATLKCNNSIIKRPITKLCLLPMCEAFN